MRSRRRQLCWVDASGPWRRASALFVAQEKTRIVTAKKPSAAMAALRRCSAKTLKDLLFLPIEAMLTGPDPSRLVAADSSAR